MGLPCALRCLARRQRRWGVLLDGAYVHRWPQTLGWAGGGLGLAKGEGQTGAHYWTGDSLRISPPTSCLTRRQMRKGALLNGNSVRLSQPTSHFEALCAFCHRLQTWT